MRFERYNKTGVKWGRKVRKKAKIIEKNDKKGWENKFLYLKMYLNLCGKLNENRLFLRCLSALK
ncbi:MAG: hypothetical protein IJA82_02695 [Clostridia bacterium]|nr:hypothetical protein [Clostridia bacterium]